MRVEDARVFDLLDSVGGETTLTEPTVEDASADRARRLAALRVARRLPPPAPEPDALPPVGRAPEGLPALDDESSRVTVEDPSRRAADEASTGLFDSWEWDEADPITSGSFPALESALEPTPAAPTAGRLPPPRREPIPIPEPPRPERPSLSLVQNVPAGEEDEALEGIRAVPLPIPPRPGAGAPWPPPAPRPQPEYPEDWLDEAQPDTIAIVPRSASRGDPLLRAALAAGAWALGFAATFFSGLATAGGGVLVVAVLTLG